MKLLLILGVGYMLWNYNVVSVDENNANTMISDIKKEIREIK